MGEKPKLVLRELGRWAHHLPERKGGLLAVWAAMDVLRRLLKGIHGEVKFGLFAVEHSRRMSRNGQLVEQERFRLVRYTSLGYICILSMQHELFV